MCDEFSCEANTSAEVMMSSSTQLPSLTSTVMPLSGVADGNDLSQFNYLINLITIPVEGINFETNQKINDNIDAKKLKHRQTER